MRSIDGIPDFARLVWTGTRGAFTKAVSLQVLGSLSEIFSILLLIPLLRLFGSQRDSLVIDLARIPVLGFDQQLTVTLPMIVAGFVIATIFRCLLLEWKEVYSARVMFGFAAQFQHWLFSAVTRTRWQVLGRYRTADLTQILTTNVDRLMLATNQLLLLVQSAVMAAIFTLASLLVSWRMTLAGVLIGLIVFASTHATRRRSFRHGQTIAGQRRDEFRLVDDFLGGLRTAKTFGLEGQHLAAMDSVLHKMYRHNIRFISSRSRGTTIYQMLVTLGVTAFIYFALAFQAIGLPVLLAMLFIFMRLAPRVMALHTSTQELASSIAPVRAAVELLKICRDNVEKPVSAAAVQSIALDHGIGLDTVSFRYDLDDPPVLDKVTAFIPARAITAISGASGSGKSTLLDIVSGLLPTGAGKLVVDGVTLDDALVRSWRRHVAFVPQDTFLFNDTLAANLRLGDETIDDGQLWTALELADAAEMVRSKPEGLDTSVGNRGQSLSGGERQRIAIARAILRRPRLLILDEATSALDAASEARIVEAVRSLRDRMTIVVVAHRPAMLAAADHVIVLEDGKASSSPVPLEVMDGGRIAL